MGYVYFLFLYVIFFTCIPFLSQITLGLDRILLRNTHKKAGEWVMLTMVASPHEFVKICGEQGPRSTVHALDLLLRPAPHTFHILCRPMYFRMFRVNKVVLMYHHIVAINTVYLINISKSGPAVGQGE